MAESSRGQIQQRRASRRLVEFVAIVLAVSVLIAFAVRQFARMSGRWRGLIYRLSGRRPDPNVDDHTLADRVRSALGPVEKRLDLPHVHVMTQDHVVMLHGDVGWPHEQAAVVQAARDVSGVCGVESHLHVGLLPSDTRPSAGRRHAALG